MIYGFGNNEPIIELMAQIVIKSRRNGERVLRPAGLTFSQFGLLLALKTRQGINQKELAAALDSDTTTIMVVCDSLEKKGYLKRSASPTDRRANHLEITESGKTILETAHPLIYEVFKPLLSAISEKEAEVILPVMERLTRLLVEMEKGEK